MALKYEKPDPELASELAAVFDAADLLIEYIRSANNIPDDFPTEVLLDIARSMCDLEQGTAEGCRVPLEYARHRLPAIRSEHIVVASDDDRTGIEEVSSVVVRGELLDRHLVNLIAAVSTALEAYRRQSRSEIDDEVRGEAAVEHPTGIDELVTRSKEVESELNRVSSDVGEFVKPDSERADSFARQIKDAVGLNRLARTELRMPAVVVRWYQSIISALRNYPEMMRAAGVVLQVGVDLVEPLALRWSEFHDKVLQNVLEAVRRLGEDYQRKAEELEKRRSKTTLRPAPGIVQDSRDDVEVSAPHISYFALDSRHSDFPRACELLRAATCKYYSYEPHQVLRTLNADPNIKVVAGRITDEERSGTVLDSKNVGTGVFQAEYLFTQRGLLRKMLA